MEYLNYNLSYNNNSKIVSYFYQDSDSSFSSARLIVTEVSQTGMGNIICNVTSNQISSVLACDLGLYNDTSFLAKAYNKRSVKETLITTLNVVISEAINLFGNEGLLLAWIIILVSATAIFWNFIGGIWVINAAIIFVNLII